MPVSHETVTFDVHDAKVYPMLSDTAGEAPTYGPAVDVPGIADVSTDPNFATAELKGDARVMAKKGRVDRINASATYGKLAQDVLKTIMGGRIDDNAEVSSRWYLTGNNALPYFKFEFKIDDVDVDLGTLQVVLYKCNLTGGTLISGSTDNFGQPELQLEAIPIEGTIPAVVGPPAFEAVENPMIAVTLFAERTALSA